MATQQKFLVGDASVLANFITWGKGISDALTALGWGFAADTGQVNWGTLAAVPATGTYIYEVRKSADALAATFPIYIKIEYGNQTNVANLRLSVATGTNGAGTLTGNGATSTMTQGATTDGGVAREYDLSGDAGARFSLFAAKETNTSGRAFYWGVERSQDASGAYTAQYFTVVQGLGANPKQQTIYPPASGGITAENLALAVPLHSPTTSAFGNYSAFFPIFPVPGFIDNPLTMFGCVKTTEQVENSVFTVQMFGATRTYLYSTKVVGSGQVMTGGGQLGMCMRWD